MSLSPGTVVPKTLAPRARFSQSCATLSSSPQSVRGKAVDLQHQQFIGNKNETSFNALIAKEAETCHKYKIKQAENFPGITSGRLLARRLRLTTERPDLHFSIKLM